MWLPWAVFLSSAQHRGPHVVFSDIDDTLYASGGQFVSKGAGVDNVFFHKEMYPGVAQFQLELSRGPCEVEDPPLVVLLSARPATLKFALAITEDHKVAKIFKHVSWLNGVPEWGVDVDNACYGSALNFVRGCTSGMGKLKYQQWRDFAPTGRGAEILRGHAAVQSVFVGDNGQCDVWAAELMRENSDTGWHDGARGQFPLRAAFIHHVQPGQGGNPEYSYYAERSRLQKKSIFLFETYAEAAEIAYQQGLISQRGYLRVLQSVARSNLGVLCQAHQQLPSHCDDSGCYPWFDGTCHKDPSGKFDFHTVFSPPLEMLQYDYSASMGSGKTDRRINNKGRCDALRQHFSVQEQFFGSAWYPAILQLWQLPPATASAAGEPRCSSGASPAACGECLPGYMPTAKDRGSLCVPACPGDRNMSDLLGQHGTTCDALNRFGELFGGGFGRPLQAVLV